MRVETRAQIKVLELAAQELQDELFGFHLARSFDLREIGLVYYVLASSEQLVDALRDCERYSLINNEGVRLHFSLAPSAAIALDYVNVDRLVGSASLGVLAGYVNAHLPAGHRQSPSGVPMSKPVPQSPNNHNDSDDDQKI